MNGPVPKGKTLDHFVCDKTLCCNPEHVRPETLRDNILRSNGVTAQNARKKRCPKCKGKYTVTPRGTRQCRPCYLDYLKKYNANRNGKKDPS